MGLAELYDNPGYWKINRTGTNVSRFARSKEGSDGSYMSRLRSMRNSLKKLGWILIVARTHAWF